MIGKRKIPLGAPVIIDTIKSKYNLKNDLNKEIALMPEGIVTAYCDEFSGQFLIIKLRSNIEIKVSENELSECTRNYYSYKKITASNLVKRIKDFFRIEVILSGDREIKYLLNPLTFIKWLLYAFKDVF